MMTVDAIQKIVKTVILQTIKYVQIAHGLNNNVVVAELIWTMGDD